MKKNGKMNFQTIGIVGWKDKNPDLALALDMISKWAVEHPQVTFCVLDNLKDLAHKPINSWPLAVTVRCFRRRIWRSGTTRPFWA